MNDSSLPPPAATDAAKPLERDRAIDVLRTIGLLGVILAHTDPPKQLFEVRNFDVVLLVVCSGMAFMLSLSSKRFWPYVWARTKRLILPVWLFLAALFCGLALVPQGRAIMDVPLLVNSFLMTGGIGYVWIMRVFMTVAVVAPFLLLLSRRIRSDLLFFAVLTGAILVYHVTSGWVMDWYTAGARPGDAALDNHSPANVLFQTIGYSLVFAFGLRLIGASLRLRMGLAIFWCAVFLAILATVQQGQLGAQEYKFPPRLPFLAYGLAVTCVLYLLAPLVAAPLERARWLRATVDFISANSIWIYLWHIPVVLVQRQLEVFGGWLPTYIVALVFALVTTLVQRRVVEWIVATGWLSPGQSNWMRQLLTG